MNFASVRIIVSDVKASTAFYENVTGLTARWGTEDFSEIVTGVGTLALGSPRTVGLFGEGTAEPGRNRTAILEFRVDDVDAEFDRLRADLDDIVQEPTTMPWGNRSALFRDPDGTLVNLFTPVSPEAVERFDG